MSYVYVNFLNRFLVLFFVFYLIVDIENLVIYLKYLGKVLLRLKKKIGLNFFSFLVLDYVFFMFCKNSWYIFEFKIF